MKFKSKVLIFAIGMLLIISSFYTFYKTIVTGEINIVDSASEVTEDAAL